MGLFGQKKKEEYGATCADCGMPIKVDTKPISGRIFYCDECKARILKSSRELQDKIKRF